MNKARATAAMLITKFKQTKRTTRTAIVLTGTFAILGVIAIGLSNAATSLVSSEAEAGTLGGNAAQVSNIAGASGGRGVQFKSATGPTPPPSGGAYKTGFVYRDGRNMMLDGKVYKAPGVNNFALTGCHHGYEPSTAEMDSFFSKMKPNSMVRTWAFSYSNESLIDRAIASAEKNSQKLVLALADGAEYCGAPDYDNGFYSSGFKGDYFDWITHIVSKHKGSPAVGAWEIMNETGLKGGGVSSGTIKSFIDQTAAHIKASDPSHLVSSGTLAPWSDMFKGVDGYANAHSGPNVDIVSLHEYDYAQSGEIISNHFSATKGAAEKVKKPIIIGETGVTKKSGCMSQADRANIYKEKMDAYLREGASSVFFWGITYPPNEDQVCNEEYGSNDPVNGAVMQMVNNYTAN